MLTRAGKLEPWYHVSLPQCDAETKRDKERCIFSARYSGKPPGRRNVNLCKTHADMADFPVKLIQPSQIIVREG